MGDLVGSITGGSKTQTETRNVDPTTQALNKMRLGQAGQLFGGGNYGGELMQVNPGGAYTPSGQVQNLYNQAQDIYGGAARQLAQSPGFNLSDYQNLGLGTLQNTYGAGVNQQQGALQSARDSAAQGLNQAQGGLYNQYTQGRAFNQQDYDVLRNQAYNDAANSRGQAAQTYTDLYGKLSDLGFNQASNYVSRVATPQLMQSLALQGLEGGGAAPAAIAKASAEQGMNVYKSLAELSNQYQGVQGQLTGLGQQGQQQLAGQFQKGQQALGEQYGTNLANQYGQYNQANAAAQNQYSQALASLSNQYGANQGAFIQSLPGAYGTSITAPAQAAAGLTQAASNLFPIADYSRQLQQADLNRRQQLYSGVLNAMPYTAGGQVTQQQVTPSMFSNLTGLGAPSSFLGLPGTGQLSASGGVGGLAGFAGMGGF